MKYKAVALFVLALLACSEGPQGPVGPEGPRGVTGDPGSDSLTLSTNTGVIYNKNYETANASWAALPLCGTGGEPAVLFFGIANVNGVYNSSDWEAVIFSDGNDGYDVDGVAGYYLLVYDPSRTLLTENYKIKYLR